MGRKQNTSAKQVRKETAEANDKRTTARKSNKDKVKITAPVAGSFGLSHNVGDVVFKDKKQAKVLVEAGCAEYVKS